MTTGTAALQLVLALVAAILGTVNLARAEDFMKLLRGSPWQALALPLSLYVGAPPLRLLLALWGPSRVVRRAACSHTMQVCMHVVVCTALLTVPIAAAVM